MRTVLNICFTVTLVMGLFFLQSCRSSDDRKQDSKKTFTATDKDGKDSDHSFDGKKVVRTLHHVKGYTVTDQFEIRGDEVYSTPFNEDNMSFAFPVYEIKNNELYRTLHHP